MTILEQLAAATSSATASASTRSSPVNTAAGSSPSPASISATAALAASMGVSAPLAALSTTTASVAAAAMQQAMISSMGDRYITPEYLAPLPPSGGEKTGKSPLQLLAQTCSQIGADTSSNKLLQEKSGNNSENNNNKNKRSPNLVVTDAKPVSFKPYENNASSAGKDKSRSTPSSVVSLSPSAPPRATPPKMSNGKSPSPKSSSSASATPVSSSSAPVSSSSETIPVIRSGMEILAGSKDPLASAYQAHMAAAAARMPGSMLDPSNPAFRPPFGAAGTGVPHGMPPPGLAGLPGVCRDPYCRDPTCPTAMYMASLGAASSLPPGYAELLQAQKLSAMGVFPPTSIPTTTAANSMAAMVHASAAMSTSVSSAGGSGPYICNWMNGRDGYFGKRHTSAEELLQHLRTHTNLSTSDAAAASSAAAAASSLYPHHGLLGSAAGASAQLQAQLQRSYAGSALGSLAAASRFHPYGKPGAPGAGLHSALPPSLGGLGALGMPPTPLPPSLAGLGAGYPASAASLYALYGSRLGSLP